MAVLSGCTESKVDHDQDIALSGRLVDEAGAPLPDALVKLYRSENSSCAFAAFSASWKTVKTRADGTFSLDLLGADTRSGSIARCFIARSPAQAEGRSLSAYFLIQQSEVALPTFQEWTGAPTVAAEAQGVSVGFQPLSATHGAGNDEHVLSVGPSSVTVAWRVRPASSPVHLSDYVLEDAEGLKASFGVERAVEAAGVTVGLAYSSDDVDLPRRALVPVSRGAACTYLNAESPCRITNGDLGGLVLFEQGVQEVAVQLSRPVVPRKAVLRNLEVSGTLSELVLEGSADGTQWMPLANLLGDAGVQPFLELDLPGTTPVSQVRVRATPQDATGTGRLRSLGQLSLFE
ncbi:carboxypeptidase-like regulatory domain-containing protein [Myxococcus sp. Y35]|uniref:carboxypeptidase-like regulatory domain-containing protein n=1 Tax=Pseudomyxococcus flavus TaxID=3115648 RepID=UPI003CF5FC5A